MKKGFVFAACLVMMSISVFAQELDKITVYNVKGEDISEKVTVTTTYDSYFKSYGLSVKLDKELVADFGDLPQRNKSQTVTFYRLEFGDAKITKDIQHLTGKGGKENATFSTSDDTQYTLSTRGSSIRKIPTTCAFGPQYSDKVYLFITMEAIVEPLPSYTVTACNNYLEVIPGTVALTVTKFDKGRDITTMDISMPKSMFIGEAGGSCSIDYINVGGSFTTKITGDGDNYQFTIAHQIYSGNTHSFRIKIGDEPVILVLSKGGTKENISYDPAAKHTLTEDDFDVLQNADGTVTITKYLKPEIRDVVIPAKIYNFRVTAIANNAFKNVALRSVVIPDTVISIGDSAFLSCGLKSVDFGKGVKTIGSGAFNSNQRLANIVLPDSVTKIGGDAFAKCGAKTLTIGKGLSIITVGAFSNNRFESITIPGTVKEVQKEAFSNCPIKTLTLNQGINLVWSGAFDKNPIETLTIPNSLADYKLNSNRDPINGIVNSVIGITAIPGGSFTTVTLPANMADENLKSWDEGLVNFYKSQGKKAGTYLKRGRLWTLQ